MIPKTLPHPQKGWVCLASIDSLKFAPSTPRSCSKYPPDSGGSCSIYYTQYGLQPKE